MTGCAQGALLLLGSAAMAQQATTAATDRHVTMLDRLTISATMVDQSAIDAMAAVSHLTQEELERIQANTAAELFRAVPGVAATMNGDDPATAINIRGLQQEGRVVVTLDGARQDYWRVGHGSGSFYVEPELLKAATVIRGPVSNAYGSGGIGGVVSFETKDASDFLRPGETWAVSEKLSYETNGKGVTTSTTGAVKLGENADIIGNFVYRDRDQYQDGDGATVPWTGENVTSGFAKGTFRPAEGHEIKLSVIRQNYEDIITGSSGSPSATLSRFDAVTTNQTYSLAYDFDPVDNDLIDFSVDLYHNRTRAEQTQVFPLASAGTFRYYDVATTGFNANNASRFPTGDIDNTVTVGGDFYYLTGDSQLFNRLGVEQASHFGSGEQYGYGAYLQWQAEYNDLIETVAALRYDGYRLDGQTKTAPLTDVTIDGGRLAPRLTVGVTPIEGFQVFGTYSEGYRAPGLQNIFRGTGAHGDTAYVPNFSLKPEVARSWEAGINLKYDDLFMAGDMFRSKLTVFHTNIDDYIEVDLTRTPRSAYNIGPARLQGVELESLYDFGPGFINLTGSLTQAEITGGIYNGQALDNTPLERFSATVGARFLDDQLTVGAQYLAVGGITRTQRSNPAAADVEDPGYNLVNLFADYQVNDNTHINLGVDNLFNTSYTDPQSSWSSTAITEQGKGRTFKISLTGRIGG
ncbi:MAG: TonB-dependent hemoglobin/transferrin/lactoferrin family receptor [Candidatus Devosia phytovorans]|uniref:TonB-dependent hemoglobin/transferrin/lactoferrin family receptor n=1 Tax=Candidatus Devosia phytovorans TaxID=3121372 RepID=A0AAJ5VTC6_9HYPH|nr:TonB-dependent hemoglobin/transferrin/lactoferrin family receptor [Devosia sp.]WEK03242.1 MAG: TonB-dependent hemoglobin/transferrin/lactoferrin family receptor [Devosia sp.]